MNPGRLFAALLLGGSMLTAQPQPERLRLDDLIVEALQKNPEVLAAQNRYEAARQRPRQESSLPDLLFSPAYSSNGNPWPFVGVGTWQTSYVGATVSQEFPFPGKRKLRGEIAAKEAQAEFQEYERIRLSVISRLKRAYYQLSYAWIAIDILGRNRELLGKLRRGSEVPFFTGQAAQQAQIAVLEARILKMEREKRSREIEINSLLNQAADAPLNRPADLEPAKLSLTLEELRAAARRNAPLLRRQQNMIEKADLALRLAHKAYYPDYTVSAGYFNMGRMPDMYQLRIDFKLPAFFWRKQRLGVAEQGYRLGEARRDYDATDLDLRFRIENAYLSAETSSRLTKMYADTVIPQANRALESYLGAYEAGVVDFIAVQMTLMVRVESELTYHEESLNYTLALVGLEELTGLSLVN